MAACDTRFPSLIDAMIVEPMAPAAWGALRSHLPGCATCRERYNRVSLAERMLHGGPSAIVSPSPASFDRIGAAVLVASTPRRPGLGERFGALLAATPKWAFGAIALAITGALMPLVLHAPMRPAASPEFAVRGALSDPAQQSGLRAFCLAPAGGSADVRPLDPGATPAQCGASDLIKFTYSNRAGYEELFLVGVDGSWSLKWYEPRPPSSISVPAARAVDQPVGGAIRVGVNHDPGPVRVFALFAHAPISAREVESAVADLKRGGASVRDAAALPLAERTDVVQRSLLIEVTAARP